MLQIRVVHGFLFIVERLSQPGMLVFLKEGKAYRALTF